VTSVRFFVQDVMIRTMVYIACNYNEVNQTLLACYPLDVWI